MNKIDTGGGSRIVFRPISEITATMEKSLYPFAIADTFEIAATELKTTALAAIPRVTRRWQLSNARCGF
jgi:hypothetical protein